MKMTIYEITRTDDIPEPMRGLGLAQVIRFEADTCSMPLPGEIEEKGGTAYFNGFPFELRPGDKVEVLHGERLGEAG